MNEVLSVVVSIAVTLIEGLLCFFFAILAENKKEVWDEIKDKYYIGE